ncbi:MAG: hypothetical protein M2R45_02037 [Verrucomicrobia subdivision 3 bacterium]|nr:hypothetical protein [Limisphaerales bacterium]MCS1414856.1 hypothetical protein [Limisphaerales bacterium]
MERCLKFCEEAGGTERATELRENLADYDAMAPRRKASEDVSDLVSRKHFKRAMP